MVEFALVVAIPYPSAKNSSRATRQAAAPGRETLVKSNGDLTSAT